MLPMNAFTMDRMVASGTVVTGIKAATKPAGQQRATKLAAAPLERADNSTLRKSADSDYGSSRPVLLGNQMEGKQKRKVSTVVPKPEDKLPYCDPGQVIIALRIVKDGAQIPAESEQFYTKATYGVFLNGDEAEVLKENKTWLEREVLEGLVLRLEVLSKGLHLSEERIEVLPIVYSVGCFNVSVWLSLPIAFYIYGSFSHNWIIICSVLSSLSFVGALASCKSSTCFERRRKDPQEKLEDFVSNWCERFALTLTFHRGYAVHLSYFCLRR